MTRKQVKWDLIVPRGFETSGWGPTPGEGETVPLVQVPAISTFQGVWADNKLLSNYTATL